MRLSITPTNAEYYETIQADATGEHSTRWTVRKDCAPGDLVLLYVCAPVQAIVAQGRIASKPELCEDLNHPWYGHYFADIEDLQLLKFPITRQVMRAKFWGWRYWKMPRSPVQVPIEHQEVLAEFVLNTGEPMKVEVSNVI